jgi:hypothetical protein
MPILLNCASGKQLRVPDEFAGKRIKCPACGEVQTVPNEAFAASPRQALGRAAAPPSEPVAPAMIQFACECGKVMQAKAEFAGRSTRCPNCQSTILIPEPAEGAKRGGGIRADRPAAKRAAFADDGGDFDYDEEPIRKGRRSRRKKGNPVLWASLAGAALLLLIVGGVAGFIWPGWFRGGKVSAEMALVPENTQMFFTVRAADLWNLDLTKKLLKEVPMPPGGPADLGALAEKEIGLSPADVERVTGVFVDLPKQGGLMAPPLGGQFPGMAQGTFFFIVNTNKAYDRQKIQTIAVGPNPSEQKHKEKAFQVGMGKACYFVDDRTFAVGNDGGIRRCIEQHVSGSKPKGELAEALQVASGKNHLVWWIKASPELLALGQMGMGGPMGGAKDPSAEGIKDVTFILDLGNTLSLDVSANYESSAKAEAAKKLSETQIAQVKQQLPVFEGAMLAGQPKEVQQLVNWGKKALNSITIDRSGSSVHFRLKTDLDADAIVGAIRSLAGKGKR